MGSVILPQDLAGILCNWSECSIRASFPTNTAEDWGIELISRLVLKAFSRDKEEKAQLLQNGVIAVVVGICSSCFGIFLTLLVAVDTSEVWSGHILHFDD